MSVKAEPGKAAVMYTKEMSEESPNLHTGTLTSHV